MKIYSNVFDLNNPSQKTIWTAPQSNAKVGIKVLSNGVEISGYTVKRNGTAISASDDPIDGFGIYDADTGSAGSDNIFVIQPLSSMQKVTLVQVVTDSTVFERTPAGGGGGGDFDPTKYYKKTETSSATELQTAFGGVDLSVASLDTSVLTNTNDISAISAFTNEVGPILSGDGEQTFGLQGEVMNLTGDVSMLQSTVNDMYGDVQSLTSEVYNGDSTDRCAKVIVDNNCSADGMGNWTQGVTNIRQISQSEYDDLVNNMETDSHCLYIIAGSI